MDVDVVVAVVVEDAVEDEDEDVVVALDGDHRN